MAKDHVALFVTYDVLQDLLEVLELADVHRWHAETGLADFVESTLYQALVSDHWVDEPDHPSAIPVDAPGKLSGRDLAKPVAQPVDAVERGEGVVDRRRQGPQGDLLQLIDRKAQVLG